jgi:hypothetical protein
MRDCAEALASPAVKRFTAPLPYVIAAIEPVALGVWSGALQEGGKDLYALVKG